MNEDEFNNAVGKTATAALISEHAFRDCHLRGPCVMFSCATHLE